MNPRTSLDLHRYDALWNLAKILRYIGWGIMLLGGGLVVLYFALTLSTMSSFGGLVRSGGLILLLPLVLSAGLMLGSAIAIGVGFLAFAELLKAIIDIAFFNMQTSNMVTNLVETERSPADSSGLKEELAQMTAVLREVNINTQKTALLLEQLTKPRPAAK